MNPRNRETEHEFRIFNGGAISRKSPSASKPPDIELITIQPNTYTSLRDIIAASSALAGSSRSPSNAPGSPIFSKSNGEVSIRNPLVKQAAMAYLQPYSSMGNGDRRSWKQRLKGCFAGEDDDGDEIGCMGPLNGDVLAPIKDVFGRFVRAFSTVDRIEEHRD